MSGPGETYRVLAPDGLGSPRGYSHGLLGRRDGRVLFVAGQTGVGPGIDRAERSARSFAEQFEVALRRVIRVVAEGGGSPEDVGRMTVFVTDLAAYGAAREELGDRWRAVMGRHYPAMSLVEVTGLVDEAALVEIEATALVPTERTGASREGEDG